MPSSFSIRVSVYAVFGSPVILLPMQETFLDKDTRFQFLYTQCQANLSGADAGTCGWPYFIDTLKVLKSV
jgi:hypothetical protein